MKKLAAGSLVLGAFAACHTGGPPPNPDTAVAVGAKIPESVLTTPQNTRVALADVVAKHNETVVVFYRGYF